MGKVLLDDIFLELMRKGIGGLSQKTGPWAVSILLSPEVKIRSKSENSGIYFV